MPTYCYQDKQGFIHERVYRMGEAPKTIDLGARGTAKRSFGAEVKTIPATSGWPMECLASGVNASDREKLANELKHRGVPTDVSKDGNPIYRDARHRARALKARGFYDKNAYA
jgi:predicted nucleic acid-binding Zn ribbon protein